MIKRMMARELSVGIIDNIIKALDRIKQSEHGLWVFEDLGGYLEMPFRMTIDGDVVNFLNQKEINQLQVTGKFKQINPNYSSLEIERILSKSIQEIEKINLLNSVSYLGISNNNKKGE